MRVGSETYSRAIVSGSLIVEPTDSNTAEFFDALFADDVDFSDVGVQEFAKRALVRLSSLTSG